MYTQTLLLVQPQPEGTDSRLQSSHRKQAVYPGPVWAADCRLTGMRPRVREVQSMCGKERVWLRRGWSLGDCAGVSGGPGHCWQTGNKHVVRECLRPRALGGASKASEQCGRLCCSAALGRERTLRDFWINVHLAPQRRGCRMEFWVCIELVQTLRQWP